jgi:hypothetical protein
MRVLDVPELGWPAALVKIDGECLLLLDPALEWEDRIDVLSRAVGGEAYCGGLLYSERSSRPCRGSES